MVPIAVFGIESDALDTAVKLLILVLVVVWLALVYYTYADARRRIAGETADVVRRFTSPVNGGSTKNAADLSRRNFGITSKASLCRNSILRLLHCVNRKSGRILDT